MHRAFFHALEGKETLWAIKILLQELVKLTAVAKELDAVHHTTWRGGEGAKERGGEGAKEGQNMLHGDPQPASG